MMPKKGKSQQPPGAAQIRRTSFDLPVDLVKRAKIRAVEEGADLRSLVIEGLELRLERSARSKARTGVPIRGRVYTGVREPKGGKA